MFGKLVKREGCRNAAGIRVLMHRLIAIHAASRREFASSPGKAMLTTIGEGIREEDRR